MSASDQLQNAWQQWQTLAKAEGDAIRTGNWAAVADCQSALQKLQPHIARCTDQARQEWSRAETGTSRDKELQKILEETIALERQNQVALGEILRTTRAQFNQLQQAGHTLRQVQRSYAPAPAAAWSSFS